MNTLTIILAGCLCVSTVLLSFSVYYNIKFGKLILKYIDQIEETLDVFDTKYASISTIVEMPLFYDSQEIRSVITDIKDCRDQILKTANILGDVEEVEEAEPEK